LRKIGKSLQDLTSIRGFTGGMWSAAHVRFASMKFSATPGSTVLQYLCHWLLLTVLLISLPAAAQQASDADDGANDTATSEAAEQAPGQTGGSIIARDIFAKAGDTFRSIARRELGKTGLSPHLAEFNNLPEDAELTAGQLVRIPLYVPARREFAKVVFVKGIVLREDVGLKRDDEVHLNDLIATGGDGFVSLEFSSGSVVNLQPHSSARLVRLNCLQDDSSCLIEIDAASGEVAADVESRDGQPTEFRINTPHASAAVRGTAFDVDTREESVLIGVTEGDVDVSAQDESVRVLEGFGSMTEDGNPPGQPVPLPPAPVYRYVPTRATTVDWVGWWELTDVVEYEAHLSIDSTGKSVVAEFDATDNQLQVEGVAPGDYYLNLRGIDDSGFRGFISSTRLTVAEIDESIPTVATSVDRQGGDFLVSVVNPPDDAPGYEIQISSTAEFNDPWSIDVNEQGAAVFRTDSEQVFARARILLDPLTVSAFGEVAESR